MGQNLEAVVGVFLPQAAPAGGFQLTVTSSDPSKLVVAGRAIDAGTGSLTVSLAQGLSTAVIFVQALASSGTATLTASVDGLPSGTATITLSPSAFILATASGTPLSTINTDVGRTTSVYVYPARLDASFNFVEDQRVGGGPSVNVTLNSSSQAVGTITPSPVVFQGGDQAALTQFTGSQAQVSRT